MTPPPRTWQRIIHELERLGGYAPQAEVLRAAGFAPGTSDPTALVDATYSDHRLYEDVVQEHETFGKWVRSTTSNRVSNTRTLYLGLLGWPGTDWRAPTGCECPACTSLDAEMVV